jgi:hypothetical protein
MSNTLIIDLDCLLSFKVKHLIVNYTIATRPKQCQSGSPAYKAAGKFTPCLVFA